MFYWDTMYYYQRLVAEAWIKSGNGESRVYPLELDQIKDNDKGFSRWQEESGSD